MTYVWVFLVTKAANNISYRTSQILHRARVMRFFYLLTFLYGNILCKIQKGLTKSDDFFSGTSFLEVDKNPKVADLKGIALYFILKKNAIKEISAITDS